MATIKVSPKFQIVIPKDIRQQANIQPGQTMEIFLLFRNDGIA